MNHSAAELIVPPTIAATTAAATVMSLSYNFHLGSGDNGNVYQIRNNRDTTRSQTFTYDALNRIASAQSQATSGANCWGNSYTIDPWGNLTNKTVTKLHSRELERGSGPVAEPASRIPI